MLIGKDCFEKSVLLLHLIPDRIGRLKIMSIFITLDTHPYQPEKTKGEIFDLFLEKKHRFLKIANVSLTFLPSYKNKKANLPIHLLWTRL